MSAEFSSSQNDKCQSLETESKSLWSVSHLESIIDRRLRVLLPGEQVAPQILHTAFSYNLLAPGKRLRPLLTLLTSFHFGSRDLVAIDCACAVEMVHAASLILDDLPCMDDAERRRGQSTLHRKFGEDIAVLAGVGLVNMAYGVISTAEGLQAETRSEVASILSSAVGSNGLIGGQIMDLRVRSAQPNDLEKLNALKTGALFVAASEIGAVIAGAPESHLKHIQGFARELGLAFQIADDVLDKPEHAGKTGKDTGKDVGKPTMRTLLGDAGAREAYREHVTRCREHIASISANDAPLGKFVEHCLAQVDV